MSRISQSRIKVARRCWKKHHYKYQERIQRKSTAAPLFRGGLLHDMIEAWLGKKDPYKVTREAAKKHASLFREQREEYGETFIDDIDRVFAGYERAYAAEPLKYTHVEKQGQVELPGGIMLSYMVDGIATDKNGRRWLVERKSHKNIPDDKVRLSDIQSVLYYYAWNKEHPKEAVDGIIWDYIRTKPPRIPETLKNGQLTVRKDIDTDFYTYSSELRRLQLDPKPYKEILERLKPRGSRDFFQRVPLPAPPKDVVKSIVADAVDTATQILEEGDRQTRNLTKDCSWCEYFNLCHAELRGLDADFVRKTDYETRDPDERYKEEE